MPSKIKVSGQRMNGLDDLNQSLARNSGPIRNLKDGDKLRLRLLEEPTVWYAPIQHYIKGLENPYRWCVNPGCIGCERGAYGSQRYIVNAVDIATGQVILFNLPAPLVKKLKRAFETRDTVRDRDYIFFRTGSGQFDTEYDCEPQDKEAMNFKKFDLKDPEEIVLAEAERSLAEGSLDEKEKKSSRADSEMRAKSRTTKPDDYEDVEEEEDEPLTTKKKKKKVKESLAIFKPEAEKKKSKKSATEAAPAARRIIRPVKK